MFLLGSDLTCSCEKILKENEDSSFGWICSKPHMEWCVTPKLDKDSPNTFGMRLFEGNSITRKIWSRKEKIYEICQLTFNDFKLLEPAWNEPSKLISAEIILKRIKNNYYRQLTSLEADLIMLDVS